MRFALMIEPQQGMSYADQLASAKRAEANGFDAFFRSDHYASFPGEGGPADDRRLDRAGRARARDRADRARGPRVAGHVPPSGRVGQGRHHGRRDERRPDRGRLSARAGTTSSITSWGSPSRRSSERADLLEDQLAILHGLWGEPDGWSYDGLTGIKVRDALFRPRPVDVAGRPTTPAGGKRPRIIVGSSGSARSYRLAAKLRRRVQPQLVVARSRGARCATSSTTRAGRSAAIRRTLARSTMAGILVGRTAGRGGRARTADARDVRG